MRYALTTGLLFLMLLSVPSLIGATLVPSIDLAALTRESSQIIVGRITTVRDAGRVTVEWRGHSLPARRQIAEIQVTRSIKGQAEDNVAFQLIRPDASSGYGDVTVKQFGIFFLKGNPNDGLTVTSPYYPSVIAALEAPSLSGDDLNKVITEIVNALTSSGTSAADKVKAIILLNQIRTSQVTEELRKVADNSDQTLRVHAVAALLNRNDISRLETAEQLLSGTPAINDQYLLSNLAYALANIRDSKAIPVLARLLKSRLLETRRGAVEALRSTGDSTAIKPLAGALDDSDSRVRYQAVMGLAEITRQDSMGPAIDLYGTNESHYLEYWRNWARRQ